MSAHCVIRKHLQATYYYEDTALHLQDDFWRPFLVSVVYPLRDNAMLSRVQTLALDYDTSAVAINGAEKQLCCGCRRIRRM